MRLEGRDVISFSAGEPDFATPAHIVEAAMEACRDESTHHYSATAGLPTLRQAVAEDVATHSGVPVKASQVVVTNGGKHAVYSAMAALLEPGDEALLPSPYWVTYPEVVALSGATPVDVPTTIEQGFKVTPSLLDRFRTERTKLLMFVSPSNPTGAVYSPEETAAIGRWAADHDIWVLTDEIYQRLVYGDKPFTSLPAATPELGDRWVIVNGVAKTYAMTGWRVGWLVGPPDVAAAAERLQSHLSSNVANVAQRAALAALTGPQQPAEAMRQAFDRRRRAMFSRLSAIPGVRCLEPEGAFYAFPDLSAFLGGRFASSLDLAAHLLEEAEVAMVPGEGFGAPGHARLSYALSDSDLERGMDRLADALAQLSPG